MIGFLTIARITGDPDALLDGYRRTAATMADVGRDHGLLLHAVAPTDDGLLMVNLWPSEDGSRSAAADLRRLAVLREHRLTPEAIVEEHHVVTDLVIPGASPGRSATAAGAAR